MTLVEAHLVSVLGPDSGRAGVSFLGVDRIDVLRFGPDADRLVRYVTLGMSRTPMTGADAALLDEAGPRAELLLTVRETRDSVLSRLAVLAASPAVEGIVIRSGARLDVGEPLWDRAAFSAVLVGRPDGQVPTLDDPTVEILPVFPMTANENAWARVHGSDALTQRWLAHGTDLRDPNRAAVDLAAS